MQNINTKGSLKSGVLSAIKYVCGLSMFGMIVLLVIATFIATN